MIGRGYYRTGDVKSQPLIGKGLFLPCKVVDVLDGGWYKLGCSSGELYSIPEIIFLYIIFITQTVALQITILLIICNLQVETSV